MVNKYFGCVDVAATIGLGQGILPSALYRTGKTSKLWIRSHLKAMQAAVGPKVECFMGRCTTQALSRPFDLAGTKWDASSNTPHAEVDTNDASHQSNLRKSSTNPSTSHRSSVCAVIHVCQVDRHLSVLTHSTLTSTSCATSFKQLHAEAVLEGIGFCETPLVHHFLFHHAERKDAAGTRRRVKISKPDIRRGRCILPREGPEKRRGKS